MIKLLIERISVAAAYMYCIICAHQCQSWILNIAGSWSGSHLISWRCSEREGAPADAADVLGSDSLGHGSHAAEDGSPGHIWSWVLAASWPGPDLTSPWCQTICSESIPAAWRQVPGHQPGHDRGGDERLVLLHQLPGLAGQEHRQHQAEAAWVLRLCWTTQRCGELWQAPVCQYWISDCLHRSNAGGE